MKRLENYYLAIERRLDAESPWVEIMRFEDNKSVEQVRAIMERLEPVLPTAEHRIVETRVERTKTVID
jgi:hypothetical protein